MSGESVIKIGINALLIQKDKILLGKRLSKSGHGDWGVPGGHLEFGETLEQCLKRELKEELGIDAREFEFKQFVNDPRKDEHYLQSVFLVKSWDGEISLMEPDKCEKWEWFPLDSLPPNIFFGHKEFVSGIKNNEILIETSYDKER